MPCPAANDTAERPQLAVRDRALDHRRADAELDEGLDVGLHGTREAPDLGVETGGGDQLDRLPVVLGDAREARLDAVDADCVERPCDLELVLGAEHDADRLLAVAQGGVVQADRTVRLRIEGVPVDVARPDLAALEGHQATIPSGKGESFCGDPSGVTRKLSSTRSPPP